MTLVLAITATFVPFGTPSNKMELHQAPGSPVLSPPSWSPLFSQSQNLDEEEDTLMYDDDPNQEESEPICASVVPPPPVGISTATSANELETLIWSSSTHRRMPSMLSTTATATTTTTTFSFPEDRVLPKLDGFLPINTMTTTTTQPRALETPGHVNLLGVSNPEHITCLEGRSMNHVDTSFPQDTLRSWFEFQARFPRDLETASLCLTKSILSSLRAPLTTNSWNNAVAFLPIPLSNCSIAGIGIYHVVRQLALKTGRAAPGPLFVPALGRLAILLPNNVRWPATLTQPPENYVSWPGKRFLDRHLRAVSDAAEVLSAYTLQLSVEILNVAESNRDPNDLAMRCFSTLDLIARFVSDMIAVCKNENRVRLRSQWDPYLLKFLGQHRLVPKSRNASESSSPLQLLFEATLEDRAAIENDLVDLENEHNLGPCIHWTQP